MPALFKEVEAHVNATGQPETFPGMHPGPIQKDVEFTRLGKILLDPAKRPDGDLAFCPMCYSRKRFKEGWFVYFPTLKAVAVIGNECASKDCRTSADRQWNERQRKLREEAHLERTIPLLRDWLDAIKQVRPVASAATALLKSFRSEGRTFREALASAANDNGLLVVTEIMEKGAGPQGMRTRGSKVQTRDHKIGRLSGLKALSKSFHPANALERIRELIEPHVRLGEEAVMEYITGPDVQRRAAYQDLRKAEDAYQALTKDLEDARSFFSTANLQVIANWSDHPLAPYRFEVKVTETDTGTRLLFYAPGQTWYPIVQPELWGPLPPLAA